MLPVLFYLAIVPGFPLLLLIIWMNWFIKKREKGYRRPFTEMSRPAGWSLQNQYADLMGDFTMYFMMGVVIGVAASALAFSGKVNPWLYLAAGLLGCSGFLFVASRKIQKCSNIRLGLLGEQAVGRILDKLSSETVKVYHDLEVREEGKKPWNIDHVVLTPAGVFAIETKAKRKLRGTDADGQDGYRVSFDGDRLKFPAPMGWDSSSVRQAANNAAWLGKKLSRLNGCSVAVTPVLVFPGWFVEEEGKGAVAVLNPQFLPNFLIDRPQLIPEERRKAIGGQLGELSKVTLV